MSLAAIRTRFAARFVAAVVVAVGVAATLVAISVSTRAYAQALPIEALPDGSEILITDEAGRRFLGYGSVEGNVLRLMLDDRPDLWPAVLQWTVVAPDGTVSATEVKLVAGDLVFVAGERRVAVLDALAEFGLSVAVERGHGPPAWARGGPPEDRGDGRPDDPGRPESPGGR